ncbi:MAG: hypothetical protein JJE23_05010 [Thermoleophilia bacterium]|jgi:hypothetical protein|nr:hypothetical protein [Thermoleophilia bacterium]
MHHSEQGYWEDRQQHHAHGVRKEEPGGDHGAKRQNCDKSQFGLTVEDRVADL